MTLDGISMVKKVVRGNLDIFGTDVSVSSVNSGFNNDVYFAGDKYIIKICSNGKDSLFDKEASFYIENEGNSYIPKLYRYDNSKKVIPFVYEIIERINGKSLYYHWYKMSEDGREDVIGELIKAVSSFHVFRNSDIDWCDYIKSRVVGYFLETISLFSLEEQDIMKASFELYDDILSNNKFAFIHGDLHFDNILVTDEGLKIIDFNDSMVAPFDYEFRLLYMCMECPNKWADELMDGYQKKEDYRFIFDYIKKFYPELASVKHLEERMIIYSIYSDIKLLPKFKENESKMRILENSRKLLNRVK